MSLKVVNLGLPKTGTTLARALRWAGYRVADHKAKDIEAKPDKPAVIFVADLMYRGYFETGDPGALFTAITEMNVPKMHKSIWP